MFLLAGVLVRNSGYSSPASPQRSREVVEGTGFPCMVIDSDGFRTTIPAPPSRIVSATLVSDEILLEFDIADRIVALSTFASDSGASNVVELARQVSGRVWGDVEGIVGFEPDLTLLSEFTAPEVLDLLRGAGGAVHRFRSWNSLADIRQNIQGLGRIVGAHEKASKIVSEMDQRLAAIDHAVARTPSRPRVLYLVPGGYSAGKGTMMDEILERAGGSNVAREAGLVGFGTIGTELAIATDPDFLLIADDRPDEGRGTSEPSDLIRRDPAWAESRAVREGKILVVPARHLTTLSHHIVQGVEQIARSLHPQAFSMAPTRYGGSP